MTAYSYAVVETALARIFGADARVQKRAFRGRLQHLRRLGLPAAGAKRGRTIAYSDDRQVWALLIALELEELGIDPPLAARMVTGRSGPDQAKGAWEHYLPKVVRRTRNSSGANDDAILLVEPFLISAAWRGDSKFDPTSFRDFRATADGMNEFLEFLRGWGVGTARRTCAFISSDRLRALDAVKSVQEHEVEPS